MKAVMPVLPALLRFRLFPRRAADVYVRDCRQTPIYYLVTVILFEIEGMI
jgi:hypothetical protein